MGRQRRRALRCSSGPMSKDAHKHSFYPFIPGFSLLPSSVFHIAVFMKRWYALPILILAFALVLVHVVQFVLVFFLGGGIHIDAVHAVWTLLIGSLQWMDSEPCCFAYHEMRFMATEPSEYRTNSGPQLSSMPMISIHWKYLHKIRLHECASAFPLDNSPVLIIEHIKWCWNENKWHQRAEALEPRKKAWIALTKGHGQ